MKRENIWWSNFGGLLLYPLGLDWRLFSGTRWKRWWDHRRYDRRYDRRKARGGGGGDDDGSGGECSDDRGGFGGKNDGGAVHLTVQHTISRLPSGFDVDAHDTTSGPRIPSGPVVDEEMYLTLRHTMARIPSFAPDSHDSDELAVARGEREEMSEARAKVRQNPLDTIEESKQERAFLTPLELRGLEFVGPTPDRPVEELYMVGSFNPDAETWARAFRTIAHSQSHTHDRDRARPYHSRARSSRRTRWTPPRSRCCGDTCPWRGPATG